MALTTDQIVRIVSAGGGMNINAANKTVDQLTRIAAAAVQKKTKLVFSNIQTLTVDQYVRVAAAGQGCVFFDIVE